MAYPRNSALQLELFILIARTTVLREFGGMAHLQAVSHVVNCLPKGNMHLNGEKWNLAFVDAKSSERCCRKPVDACMKHDDRTAIAASLR